MGIRPFFNALFLKISANEVLIIALKPKSTRAQGACSLDDPHPKLFPATRIEEFLASGLLRTKSSIG